jgi:hypothetical protein
MSPILAYADHNDSTRRDTDLYHFRHNAAEILTILYNFVPAAVPADALASIPSKKLAEMGRGARKQIAGPTADRVGT